MIKLLKSYKTEIDSTEEQKHKINRTIGVCRFIYNFYIAENKEIYEAEKRDSVHKGRQILRVCAYRSN